ncbi:hypothetical protein PTSG_12951 [Salpingoeca rosetta]|uniref:Secreted protein n=1 Tax=Salpingoeca rosetta (strain ATCC 50818 / BSB-021) TaxID=946362 RepID=F2UNH1_SALR5|nr:uncharacterized protein PTSG_12951 [Salpingoeca rosetta]EGD79176.1 hypothetical protein PTSG_12951 [Salpingoeca rosetta]|eukprot:XP_004989261.1 hypothetical protein PTSG_12951 [Salpingoeca rosetta]
MQPHGWTRCLSSIVLLLTPAASCSRSIAVSFRFHYFSLLSLSLALTLLTCHLHRAARATLSTCSSSCVSQLGGGCGHDMRHSFCFASCRTAASECGATTLARFVLVARRFVVRCHWVLLRYSSGSVHEARSRCLYPSSCHVYSIFSLG